MFLPQILLSFGNGVFLPNAIAGAVSVRPQAAGTASGITGFTQMAIGAVAAQAMSHRDARTPTTAMPLAWTMVRARRICAIGVFVGCLVQSHEAASFRSCA